MHLPCFKILVFHYKSRYTYIKKMSHFSQAGDGGGDRAGGGGQGHNRVTHIQT